MIMCYSIAMVAMFIAKRDKVGISIVIEVGVRSQEATLRT